MPTLILLILGITIAITAMVTFNACVNLHQEGKPRQAIIGVIIIIVITIVGLNIEEILAFLSIS